VDLATASDLMLIINADDWGRCPEETDAALACHRKNRITSASAMVFMQDSERAAELANEHDVDLGLHLNFTDQFTASTAPDTLKDHQARIAEFLTRSKYSQLLYNPFLRAQVGYCYQAQTEEFERLFDKPPSRVDGHHHMHLCANILLSSVIPAGVVVRRNFSFWPGEKNPLNRAYRGLVDRWLARRYRLTDYFFDLTQCLQGNKLDRVAALAQSEDVELMTHPISPREQAYLMSDECSELLQKVELGSFAVGPLPSSAVYPLSSGR
jgi:predicted glycoside hydrolase/deacetylase ChbG (UPF0249 family)